MYQVLDRQIDSSREDSERGEPKERRVKVSSRHARLGFTSFIIGEAYSKKLASVFGISDYVMRDIIRRAVCGRSFSFGPYTKDIAETLADKAQDIENRYLGDIRLSFTVI